MQQYVTIWLDSSLATQTGCYGKAMSVTTWLAPDAS